MDTLVHHWGCWLILMKSTCYIKRPYLFSYLLTEPGNCRRASINITLPHPQGSALFLLDVNDVDTCACGGRPPLWMASIAHDGAGPQAGTQLAVQTSRHLLGVSWAMALKSLAACSDLLLATSRFFPSTPPPPQPRTLFYRLSAGLIRADMLNVLGWADVAIAGVCVFLLWQSGGSGWRVVYYKQHGDGIQKHIYAIFTKFLDWDRNTASWAMTRGW